LLTGFWGGGVARSTDASLGRAPVVFLTGADATVRFVAALEGAGLAAVVLRTGAFALVFFAPPFGETAFGETAFFAAGFRATAFFAGALAAVRFAPGLVGVFFGAAFFAPDFRATAFFGADRAEVFLAEVFLATVAFFTAFLGAAFLATGFFFEVLAALFLALEGCLAGVMAAGR
jgi:hypothetical protein